MSSSNPTPASTPSGGSSYNYCMNFYFTTGNLDAEPHTMKNENLLQQLGILLNGDLSEKISDVWYYKNPLKWWQFTNRYLYHAFIVLKTTNFWFTIESNTRANITSSLRKLSVGRGIRNCNATIINKSDNVG